MPPDPRGVVFLELLPPDAKIAIDSFGALSRRQHRVEGLAQVLLQQLLCSDVLIVS